MKTQVLSVSHLKLLWASLVSREITTEVSAWLIKANETRKKTCYSHTVFSNAFYLCKGGKSQMKRWQKQTLTSVFKATLTKYLTLKGKQNRHYHCFYRASLEKLNILFSSLFNKKRNFFDQVSWVNIAKFWCSLVWFNCNKVRACGLCLAVYHQRQIEVFAAAQCLQPDSWLM